MQVSDDRFHAESGLNCISILTLFGSGFVPVDLQIHNPLYTIHVNPTAPIISKIVGKSATEINNIYTQYTHNANYSLCQWLPKVLARGPLLVLKN